MLMNKLIFLVWFDMITIFHINLEHHMKMKSHTFAHISLMGSEVVGSNYEYGIQCRMGMMSVS